MVSPVLAVMDSSDEAALHTISEAAHVAQALSTTLVMIGCQTKNLERRDLHETTLRSAAYTLDSKNVQYVQAQCSDIVECVSTAEIERGASWVFVPRPALRRAKLRITHASTGKRLLESVRSPLWIGATPDPNRELVLAAIDPTHGHDKPADLDRLILQYAAWIANIRKAELHVLHAVFEFDVSQDVLNASRDSRHKRVMKLIEHLGIPLRNVHIPIGLESLTIEKYAADLNAYVIVMGAIKRSSWRQLMVGSTTQTVLDRLSCDVVTVRPDAPSIE